MQIRLNGATEQVEDNITVGRLVDGLQLQRDGIAVAIGYTVVPRKEYDSHVIHEGDSVEIVRAVGGGCAAAGAAEEL